MFLVRFETRIICAQSQEEVEVIRISDDAAESIFLPSESIFLFYRLCGRTKSRKQVYINAYS